jgi:hypothetical protein
VARQLSGATSRTLPAGVSAAHTPSCVPHFQGQVAIQRYGVRSSGEVMTVHQPELLTASTVRNEVTTTPIVGTSHSKQSTSRTTLTTRLARPGPHSVRHPHHESASGALRVLAPLAASRVKTAAAANLDRLRQLLETG